MTFHETYAGLVEHNTERLAGIEENTQSSTAGNLPKCPFPMHFCVYETVVVSITKI